MGFIGKQPTPVPLTSSDITDGIITSAKITDGTITSADTDGTLGLPPFKNIIINGDMSIAQRSTSVASITASSYHTTDRWYIENNNMGTFTISQSTDVPTGQGFAKSLKFDCTTADASPASGDTIGLRQKFEGQNLQYLKFATSSAESLTLSFWIKSNKTGTYNVALFGQDSASTAQYLTKAYTISSANTWEKKTITYAGNTANGFDNDNARSLDLVFNFGTGSSNTGGTLQTVWSNYGTSADYYATQGVNLADNTANELYITGVQLEAGTTASDFEFLPVDVNMRRCQRYYSVICDRRTSGAHPIRDQRAFGIGSTHYPDQVSVLMIFPTEMRTVPSIDQATGTNYYLYYHETTSDYFSSFNSIGGNGVTSMLMRNTNEISASHGVSGTVTADSNGNSFVAFNAEL